MSLDRLPPHSIEAEHAVLGCILLDPRTVLNELVSFFGGSGVFYDLRNEEIYRTMVGLWERSFPVDMASIVSALRDANKLDECGGPAFIASLPDAAPTASSVSYYAQILEEKATLRRMIQACTKAVARIYESEDDPEMLIANAEMEVMAVRRKSAHQTPAIKELTVEAINHVEQLHQSGGKIGGLTTGLPDVDHITDGLHPGEMVILSAYTSGGKTAFAMNVAEHVAMELGLPVGVFSLEMSAKRLVMRMLASRSRVNLREVRQGLLTEEDMQRITVAASKMAKAPLHFNDLSDLNVMQIRAKARQMSQQYGVKFIVVDYLQLLAGNTKRDQNREQEVASISRGVKSMATELEIPVLALSQLNEEGKLRESRAIGQDADSVWRLKPVDPDDKSPVVAVDLEIQKQRDGQAPATVNLTFLKKFTRFESASKPWHEGL